MSQTGLRLEAGRAPLQGTGRKTSVVLDHRERLYSIPVGGKGGERIMQEYHLTEPVKISMLERSRLVRIVDGLITFCEENYPTSQIVYFRRCTHGMWRDAVRKTPTSPT